MSESGQATDTDGTHAARVAPLRSPRQGPSRFSGEVIRRMARVIRVRHRMLFLISGGLLLFAGIALPSTAALVCGMLAVGAGAPDAAPRTPITAMVRMWARPRDGQGRQ